MSFKKSTNAKPMFIPEFSIQNKTDKALLISHEGIRFWIGKSLCTQVNNGYNIPYWVFKKNKELAEKSGLLKQGVQYSQPNHYNGQSQQGYAQQYGGYEEPTQNMSQGMNMGQQVMNPQQGYNPNPQYNQSIQQVQQEGYEEQGYAQQYGGYEEPTQNMSQGMSTSAIGNVDLTELVNITNALNEIGKFLSYLPMLDRVADSLDCLYETMNKIGESVESMSDYLSVVAVGMNADGLNAVGNSTNGSQSPDMFNRTENVLQVMSPSDVGLPSPDIEDSSDNSNPMPLKVPKQTTKK